MIEWRKCLSALGIPCPSYNVRRSLPSAAAPHSRHAHDLPLISLILCVAGHCMLLREATCWPLPPPTHASGQGQLQCASFSPSTHGRLPIASSFLTGRVERAAGSSDAASYHTKCGRCMSV